MNSLVEARIKTYLGTRMHFGPYDCGAVVFHVRHAAQISGYELDERFAGAGLGAGPDARVASGLVDVAMRGGGGTGVDDHMMRQTIDGWLRTTGPMGL